MTPGDFDESEPTRGEQLLAIRTARSELHYRSFLDAQMALIEALGFTRGDGVTGVTLRVTANDYPSVTVERESTDKTRLVDPFVPFVECYELVRKSVDGIPERDPNVEWEIGYQAGLQRGLTDGAAKEREQIVAMLTQNRDAILEAFAHFGRAGAGLTLNHVITTITDPANGDADGR